MIPAFSKSRAAMYATMMELRNVEFIICLP